MLVLVMDPVMRSSWLATVDLPEYSAPWTRTSLLSAMAVVVGAGQETQRKIDALRQQGRWIDVHGDGDSQGANGHENNIRKKYKMKFTV